MDGLAWGGYGPDIVGNGWDVMGSLLLCYFYFYCFYYYCYYYYYYYY